MAHSSESFHHASVRTGYELFDSEMSNIMEDNIDKVILMEKALLKDFLISL